MNQNRNIPNEMVLPSDVEVNSWEAKTHNSPIKKTASAIKKVCACIICLLIRLSSFKSV